METELLPELTAPIERAGTGGSAVNGRSNTGGLDVVRFLIECEARRIQLRGCSGIGAGLVNAFLERGFCVVANARQMTQSNALKRSEKLALVDGEVGRSATAANKVEEAIGKFGSIDALVNNNLEGFI
jgi:hypothetical protein